MGVFTEYGFPKPLKPSCLIAFDDGADLLEAMAEDGGEYPTRLEQDGQQALPAKCAEPALVGAMGRLVTKCKDAAKSRYTPRPPPTIPSGEAVVVMARRQSFVISGTPKEWSYQVMPSAKKGS